ncbi:MAG: isoprenyl transferase [Paludibacteraceae bacterium]|nr:isoprenyl transferase [Paludibacteraceae bacterium]
MSIISDIQQNPLPAHVAIIMDGNGRWAKRQGKERVFGHKHGVESVRAVTEAAAELGIKYLTLYAFSTENWNRPQAEVDALMALLVQAIENETPTLMKNNVRLLTIGDTGRLPDNTRNRLQQCIAQTAGNTGLSLVLALSYSSRWEITRAVKLIAKNVKDGSLNPEDIDEKLVSQTLTTREIPDPDLLIRTSGEQRISNFLMWQLAYSELYFTELCWPEFRKEAFYNAILDYQNRERRYGMTSEQITST